MAWNLPYLTGGIQLRVLRRGDVAAFLAYRSDPQVARLQAWSPMTEHEAADFLEHHSAFTQLHPGTWSQLGVAAADSDALIGDVGLCLSSDGRVVEFGMSLARCAQGRGLGTRTVAGVIDLAFFCTSVTQIIAHTDQRNVPCIKALARAGMVQTGVRVETYKGEVCTEIGFRLFNPSGLRA